MLSDPVQREELSWRDYRRGHRLPDQQHIEALFLRARQTMPDLVAAFPRLKTIEQVMLAILESQHRDLELLSEEVQAIEARLGRQL